MPGTTIKFNHGKHAGTPVGDVPSGYLKWAAENWAERSDHDIKLVEAINAELEYRAHRALKEEK